MVGGERERHTNVREKHRLVASSMHPNQESNPQGPNLQPFGVRDNAPTHGTTPARAY